jgi:hypothetical protein
MKTKFILFCLLTSAACLRAPAQGYSIDWSTIDSGGGASTGGLYSVTGTIGQPDAGQMSGGTYTLQGGFWSVVAAVQTPGAPRLNVTCNNGGVTVSWLLPAAGWVLDETPAITGPPLVWSQVPTNQYQTDSTHRFINVAASPPNEKKFYRLRKL